MLFQTFLPFQLFLKNGLLVPFGSSASASMASCRSVCFSLCAQKSLGLRRYFCPSYKRSFLDFFGSRHILTRFLLVLLSVLNLDRGEIKRSIRCRLGLIERGKLLSKLFEGNTENSIAFKPISPRGETSIFTSRNVWKNKAFHMRCQRRPIRLIQIRLIGSVVQIWTKELGGEIVVRSKEKKLRKFLLLFLDFLLSSLKFFETCCGLLLVTFKLFDLPLKRDFLACRESEDCPRAETFFIISSRRRAKASLFAS